MKKYLFKHYDAFIIILWLLIIGLFLIRYLNHAHLYSALVLTLLIFGPLMVSSIYLSSWLLPRAIREERMSHFITQFLLLTFISACIVGLVNPIMDYLENWGIPSLPQQFAGRNPVWIEMLEAIPSALVMNAGFCGLRFYYEHSLLQKTHLETQLQVLQQQINPHFMFNVLNHIHILMHNDVDKSSDLLLKYADLLRYQLYQGAKDKNAIKEEIDFLKNYIEIEELRWGDELEVSCKWEIEDMEAEVPALLLITLLENAFKHVLRTPSKKAEINMHLSLVGKKLTLEISNSATAVPIVKKAGLGLGLNNLRNRLDILYPKRYVLQTELRGDLYCAKLELNL